MGSPDDLTETWRAKLMAGSRQATRDLARLLETDREAVAQIVPLVLDPAPQVRLGAIAALSEFGRADPEALLPYLPDIMDAVGALALRGGTRPAPRDGGDAPARRPVVPDVVAAKAVVGARAPASPAPATREQPIPPVLFSTVREMLEVVLKLEWTDPENRRSMSADAIEDTLEGLVHVMEMVYRGDDHSRPWSSDEVHEILLKRVLPTLLPIRVTRQSPEDAVVEVGAPLCLPAEGTTADSWPTAVGPFVKLIASFVHPGFRLDPAGHVPSTAGSEAIVRYHARTVDH